MAKYNFFSLKPQPLSNSLLRKSMLGVLLWPLYCGFFYFEVQAQTGRYQISLVDPMMSHKILPTKRKFPRLPGAQILIEASPSEYEPASFVISAKDDIQGLGVVATAMVSGQLPKGKNTLDASLMDIKVVKSWYQAGRLLYDLNKRILVPELLLKDDSLVKIGELEKHNYLRITEEGQSRYVLISDSGETNLDKINPVDSEYLKPVSLKKGTNKQFWLSLYVPKDTLPGIYHGDIRLTINGQQVDKIPVKVVVHDIDLADPELIYGIYYRGRLGIHPPGHPTYHKKQSSRALLNSNWKTERQYLIEMQSLRAHGIRYPTSYQVVPKLYQREIELRREAGLPTDKVYSVGIQGGTRNDVESLRSKHKHMRQWMLLNDHLGVREFYAYGIDEAKGDKLIAQRDSWQVIKQQGAKIFAAIRKEGVLQMQDLLDVAVLPYEPDVDFAAQLKAKGILSLSYSNPQVGREDPAIYRRNYGVGLWRSGYSGVMNYAYQHSSNHIWNDFDGKKYRDMVFTYPTANGLIDTIQYKGFREAVDDVRYLTTLSKLISQDKSGSASVIEAQRWLKTIKKDFVPWEIRHQAIRWIKQIRPRPPVALKSDYAN